MQPTLIGYFPKRRVGPADWLKATNIDVVASAAHCIANGPEDWHEAWQHNEWSCYDTPEQAWDRVPDDEREAFVLYAYRLFPQRWLEDHVEPLDIAAANITPLTTTFKLLGLDLVSLYMLSIVPFFEHSPLSCNRMADTIAVNSFCLIDDQNTAFSTAAMFAREGKTEPGMYHVVEVWSDAFDDLTRPSHL